MPAALAYPVDMLTLLEPDIDLSARPARFRSFVLVLTVFWLYVALTNVLWANNMQASLESIRVMVFAPWRARLLQHLFLYPLFLGCAWLSLRIGWEPRGRAIPLQVLCALAFAAAGSPMLAAAEMLVGNHHASGDEMSARLLPLWIAGIVNWLLTYGFGLALMFGLAFYSRLRDAQLRAATLERELAAAQLAALRMQLSPHTLFNLLHTIRGHIAWDPESAQSMVVQLADLLRRLLNVGERDFSPLATELEFARLYLALQRARFADRLTVSLPEPGAVPAVWVPSLILQPLIENAVTHGLAGHEAPVCVTLEAEVQGPHLVLRLRNDCAASRPVRPEGIGLGNVRRRLAIHFGDRAQLLAGPMGKASWLCELRLPVLHQEAAAGEGRSS